MTELKNFFGQLQMDAKSVLFTEETINKKVLKKLKKSRYVRDKDFVNLFENNIDFLDDEKVSIPIKKIFVAKKDNIDKSTLYSFDGQFQLLHADIGNL